MPGFPGLLVPEPELTAVADTGTFTTELGLSLVTATVPIELPAACAVKVTEKVFAVLETGSAGR